MNDTSGHVAGDELLKVVSKLFKKQVRDGDVAGRVGGDEFALLLANRSEQQAVELANTLKAEIEALCFEWEGVQHRVGSTFAVVLVDDQIDSVDHLQLLADNAHLEAKCEGGNSIRITHGNNRSASQQRENSRWLQRINDAICNDRFVLCAQEIRAVGKSADVGQSFEILIRMQGAADNDLIPPGAFLPIAERYNLSSQIDLWVVEKLTQILAEEVQLTNANNHYWVNLSGQSVGDKEFADSLVSLVGAAGVPPGSINFEITETCVVRDLEVADDLIRRLKAFGCQFALDDFGAGLASFGQLKKLPVDVIKIDGMFIREVRNGEMDRLFTKSIIELAHSLGIETVAEFVENDLIRDAVTELGVDYIQGFGIHRPEVISLSSESVRNAS